FGCVHKSTLYPYQIAPGSEQHIAPSDQLVGAARVEDGSRIYFREYPERKPGGEIGLNGAGDNVYRWPLCSDDQVDTYGTRQLGQAGDRRFHFFPCCHHEVCELIDNEHDKR